ncbi:MULTISPECIES: PHP domain-containing protein [Psychrilyobacter]|uniref:PHP domain-containing protein n=1 Tax=Psychrilyobacter piezotolerans TaxID=2293438 RepID=A0ABX9KDK8_9FUSO|nr:MULTISPECIES: PHP domain-containing protein [Psychrilyobacter]MCS5422366.1 PHP domain-containing protein [Psychrilyobacter sp. S5]NDI79099.1 PHP domain-containing protein [Psychrilyobacter piezotolerans]RDE58974.1 PHP domain-containing protein [Psychrilyobacter sp. S5]REI39541.1 PHP domain-containing protein [Psychrilyobacter piezotolerans]
MIDLHMHSTFSDGTLTPAQLVERARQNNIEVMAITDHDNVDGLKEGREEAEKAGITFVDGIEVSADFRNKDIHILGYFLNLKDEEFLGWLKNLQEKRHNRTLEMLKKLSRLGIEISLAEVEDEVLGNVIGRPHIARMIIKKGFAATMDEVFDRYLGDGKPAYIPKVGVDMVEVVKKLKTNGALVILAHPHLISHSDDTVVNIIDSLLKNGLDGLELYYPNIDTRKRKKFMKIAKKRGLILTGGSDFHGLNRAGIDLGTGDISVEVFQKMVGKKENIDRNKKVW